MARLQVVEAGISARRSTRSTALGPHSLLRLLLLLVKLYPSAAPPYRQTDHIPLSCQRCSAGVFVDPIVAEGGRRPKKKSCAPLACCTARPRTGSRPRRARAWARARGSARGLARPPSRPLRWPP